MTTASHQTPSPASGDDPGNLGTLAKESAARAAQSRSLTIGDAGILLRAAVEKRGEDYVFPSDLDHRGESGACRYVTGDGLPACIVGEVLYAIDPAIVPGHDTFMDAGDLFGELMFDGDEFEEREGPKFELDGKSQTLLEKAQRAQDSDLPWGESAHAAWAEVVRDERLYRDAPTSPPANTRVALPSMGLNKLDYKLGTVTENRGDTVTVQWDDGLVSEAERIVDIVDVTGWNIW